MGRAISATSVPAGLASNARLGVRETDTGFCGLIILLIVSCSLPGAEGPAERSD